MSSSKQSITVNVTDQDESSLQLAAMVLALRDLVIPLYAEAMELPIKKVETMVDDSYERYLDDMLKQVKQRREGNYC